jgi:transposase
MAPDERRIGQLARRQAAAQRLMRLDGLGAVAATAIVAAMGKGNAFKTGRQLAAWRGLVPRQDCRGGTQRLGHTSQRGEVSLRPRLSHGARRGLPRTGQRPEAKSRGAERLTQRRGNNSAAVALAATHARMRWARLARDRAYRRGA